MLMMGWEKRIELYKLRKENGDTIENVCGYDVKMSILSL